MRFIYTKAFAWFAAGLVLTVILLLLQSRGWLGPVQTVLSSVPKPIIRLGQAIAYPVKSSIRTMYSVRAIVRENTALRERITLLEQQTAELGKYKDENESLRRELGFVARPPVAIEPCTVIAQDPEGITDVAVINCGENKGIRIGQGVVAGGYVVGQVLFVSNSVSTVRLLTSPEIGIDAKTTTGAATGLIKGSFGSGVIMDLIQQNAVITKGDIVVTAGLNKSIPRDIVIGQVADIISGENDLFKKITVSTPVDFKNLSYVFVLK